MVFVHCAWSFNTCYKGFARSVKNGTSPFHVFREFAPCVVCACVCRVPSVFVVCVGASVHGRLMEAWPVLQFKILAWPNECKTKVQF